MGRMGWTLMALVLAACGGAGGTDDVTTDDVADTLALDAPDAGAEAIDAGVDTAPLPVAFEEQDLFAAGEGGYLRYRIPALLEVPGGGLLAFAEGRHSGINDTGDIDLVLRRSADDGATWGPLQVVVDNGVDTAGNPAPVVERASGHVWLPYCTNAADTPTERRVWLTTSADGGATWGTPVDLTDAVRPPGWEWIATGPGRSIQTAGGRVVVPCDHRETATGLMHSHVMFTDDGTTWAVGGSLGPQTDEAQVVELADGSLLLGARDGSDTHRRVFARSADGGLTWTEQRFAHELPDPGCQGSLLATDRGLVFSNPASDTVARAHLTVRTSTDDGLTWGTSRELHAGPSAYSALAPLADGRLGCLYEAGDVSLLPYDRITLARFTWGWLEGEGESPRGRATRPSR